jgi:hypothetical protein
MTPEGGRSNPAWLASRTGRMTKPVLQEGQKNANIYIGLAGC